MSLKLWLVSTVGLVTSLLVASCQSQGPRQTLQTLPFRSLSIMQASTDMTSTVLTVVVPKDKNYKYTILLDSTVLKTPLLKEKTWGDSPWKMVSFQLIGLNPGSVYDLRVSNEHDQVIDERTFRTFSKELKAPNIAIVSCLDDSFSDLQKNQWKNVWFEKPDALFLIGDNVYIDTHVSTVTDKEIWTRHIESRNRLEIYRMKTLIPVFATWDDHDYGMPDGDSRFAYKNQSKDIFQTFFPIEESSYVKKGPGVSSALTIGKQTFVFFDNRTSRTPDRIVPGDTHFGKEQEAWLANLLQKKKGPFWLIDGDQFFGSHHTFESFETNHPNSFKTFLRSLKQAKKTVIFISGDRHLAEIQKIPKKILNYETYEFTSSGLHAKMYPGALAKTPNPKQVFGQDGLVHFLMIQGEALSSRKLKLKATFFGEKSTILHRQTYEVAR